MQNFSAMKKTLIFVAFLSMANVSAADGWLDSIKEFFGVEQTKPAPVVKGEVVEDKVVEDKEVKKEEPLAVAKNLAKEVATKAAISKATGGLVPALTQQLGVSKEQAAGGAGILFDLAKNNLSAGDFSKIAKNVPDMSGLLSAVPAVSASQDMLSGLLGETGGKYAKALTGAVDVYRQFSALGLKPEHVGEYMGVVTSYLNSEGGQASTDLFKEGVASFLSSNPESE